jgi:hypothetical protein
MQELDQLSDAKRVLFNRYLHGQVSPVPRMARRPQRGFAPLSVVQEELYSRELALNGNPPLYNECVTVRMLGAVDPNVLERSFHEIIRRHEVWRTTFETKAGQPVQIVHPPMPTKIARIDLRGLSEGEREAEAIRLISEDARRPFQLNKGPLLRPTLVRMSDEEQRFFLIAHQIVLDGRSAFQIGCPLQSIFCRSAFTPTGIANSVCGLRVVAAGVVKGARGETGCFLATATGR